MNTNFYLEGKFIKYHQAELIAQAQHEALIRELKQTGKPRAKTGTSKRADKVKFNWFFAPKNHSASPMN